MNWLTDLFVAKPRLDEAQSARLAAWRALPAADTARPLEASRLVVVDVESSGLNVNRDRLIAIGAVAVANGRVALADSLEVVLRQDVVSDKANILIHGIGGEVQREGVPPAEALLAFLEYLGKDPLVAFHVAFDRTMIGRALKAHLGLRLDHPWVDLAYVAPALYPKQARRRRALDDWMDYFRIGNYARHSALADALATAELLLALTPAMPEGSKTGFERLCNLEFERRRQEQPM